MRPRPLWEANVIIIFSVEVEAVAPWMSYIVLWRKMFQHVGVSTLTWNNHFTDISCIVLICLCEKKPLRIISSASIKGSDKLGGIRFWWIGSFRISLSQSQIMTLLYTFLNALSQTPSAVSFPSHCNSWGTQSEERFHTSVCSDFPSNPTCKVAAVRSLFVCHESILTVWFLYRKALRDESWLFKNLNWD